MKEFQQNLVTAWRDYASGKIDAKTLKGASAGFGIYEQRNGKAMMRVRRVAGRVSTGDLRAAARFMMGALQGRPCRAMAFAQAF